MRLDRYLSSVTHLSRSRAQKAIRGGRVRVGGEVVKQPAAEVPETTEVSLDELMLVTPGPRYFMLHKPRGYVCSTDDKHHSSVLELLDEPVLTGLHFAGRLDIDTTGLVLVTDDGVWSHRITSPRRHCRKSYIVTLENPLSEGRAESLRCGLRLRNEKIPTRPAEVERLGDRKIRLVITEGRYHQVKRMMAAVGNRVIALHREAIASLVLDPGLQPGQYRPLKAEEVASVLN